MTNSWFTPIPAAIAFLSLLCGCAGATPPPALADYDWILGDWVAGEGAVTEQWRRVSDATFEGRGTSRSADGELIETLRLVAMSGAIYFLAKVPENSLVVPFRLTAESSAEQAVFVNPEHDFPQRFVYEKVADGMRVTVSDDSGKGFQLHFRRPAEGQQP